MIIVGIAFLTIQTILAFFKPRLFFFSYLLYISSFLGFVTNQIIIGGLEVSLFFHSLLFLINYTVYYNRTKSIDRYARITLNSIIIFYIYGLMKPVIIGESTILQSIIASKEFSTIFFFHYLIAHHRKLSFQSLYKTLSFFGTYLLIILILFVGFDSIPPEYVKSGGRIEFNYPTILSLFIFLYISRPSNLKTKIVGSIIIIIWTIGMYHEGHLAIMLTTLVGSLVVLFKIPVLKFLKNYRTLAIGIGLFAVILYLVPTNKILNHILDTPSFQARTTYNIERYELIKDRPIAGYGFIHKTAIEIGNTVYTESISFIDSGYVDLLGKFGYVGSLLYLFLILRTPFQESKDAISTSLKVFIFQFIVVNITWAVFSFSLGLVPLSIALFLLIRN